MVRKRISPGTVVCAKRHDTAETAAAHSPMNTRNKTLFFAFMLKTPFAAAQCFVLRTRL
jgi:hypothetical protein